MGEDYMKFGHYHGGYVAVAIPLKASQVFKAKSGRFIYIDSSGYGVVATDGYDELFGFAEHEEGTSNATDAVEYANVIIDPTAIFRMPVSGTYAITMIGKTCDLKVTSNVQYADVATSIDDVFIIVGGDAANNGYVDVMLNQKERAQAGV